MRSNVSLTSALRAPMAWTEPSKNLQMSSKPERTKIVRILLRERLLEAQILDRERLERQWASGWMLASVGTSSARVSAIARVSEGWRRGWDSNHRCLLKTNNLTGFDFLTIRRIRTKTEVETRIEHAAASKGSTFTGRVQRDGGSYGDAQYFCDS
jgi:hypothetical protein